MRILIVEDEAALRESLASQLKAADFTVDTAADGEEGLYAAKEYPIDLAIIDLGLPKLSGIELISQLRGAGRSIPILILTARDRWQEKVEGLQSGADDYLVKPFHFQELLARMQALLRRAGGWSQSVLQCGDISVDTRSQIVTVGDRVVELTSFEYRILHFLMMRAGEVISKAELTERLYEQDFERDSNVIEVFIGRLRRKLDPHGNRQPIETLRGRGYRLALARAEAVPRARADG
ncbi:MAG TPA: response regulator transcription factor [Steroidobacteraceae bacterium]|nr:response regulator transcription factor [Steroidobacteraceae bacterium]